MKLNKYDLKELLFSSKKLLYLKKMLYLQTDVFSSISE